MAGKIIADTIQATSTFISLNVGSSTVLTANSSGLTLIPSGNVNVNLSTGSASLTLGNLIASNVTTGNLIASNVTTGNLIASNVTTGNLIVTNGLTVGANAAPAFSAYQSTLQSVPTTTFTKIQCQTEEFDTNSNYDNATNYRFTPTVAGYYQVSGGVAVASSATSIFFYMYKNGSSYKNMGGVGGTVGAASGSSLVYLNGSTDYIELFVYLGTGQNTLAQQYGTYFQASFVRSA